MRKTNTEIKKEVNPDLFYRPSEIFKNKWIYNTKGNYLKESILRMIRLKRLEATDCGMGKISYYKVRGSEILRHIEENQ